MKSATERKLVLSRYDYAAFCPFFLHAAGSVIIPVSLVAMASDLSFSLRDGGMTEGGGLQLGRTASMILAMLPVAFVAGRWGARHTRGCSVLLMITGVFLRALAMVIIYGHFRRSNDRFAPDGIDALPILYASFCSRTLKLSQKY